jgi:hypothetical protein
VGQFTELSVTLINHYDVNKSKLEKWTNHMECNSFPDLIKVNNQLPKFPFVASHSNFRIHFHHTYNYLS